MDVTSRTLLRPGSNCSQVAQADRFAMLVDGSGYYSALADTIPRAKRTVAIVGWDLDTRARLGPSGGDGPLLPPLREWLRSVADANPSLEIYILTWDFPVIFANVRDPLLVREQDPFEHPRIHLHFDSEHPPGASHHQKVVVIDDCLAFFGGMDIAGGRWDTPEHRHHDIRRGGGGAEPYPPYHDVQAVVDGDAARVLAGIVRDRWSRAAGTPMAPAGEPWDLWPAGVEPDVIDATVGISRTDVPADAEVGCHEIEQLHLDLIAAARDSIYIENQYLTSATMTGALCRRLEADDGPEIVLVLPLDNAGWLEANTIEALRIRSVRRLRASDRFRRLRLCYPAVPGDGELCVGLHSKVLVVDDRLFRVGSSNLTNRSMRLDTELDATIEAATPEHRAAVLRLRNRLLAEHLGMPLADVEAFLSADGSLVRLVDARRAEARCLCELPQETVEPILSRELVDPDGPLDTEDLIEGLATSAVGAPARRLLPVVLALVVTAALIAFAIRRLRARSLRRSR